MNGICLWNILLLAERRLQDMLCVAIALLCYYCPWGCIKSLKNIHLLCINGTWCPPVQSYSSLFRSDPIESCPHPIPTHKFTRLEWTRGLCASSKAALRLLLIPWCWQCWELNWFISSSAPMIWNHSKPCIFPTWNAELELGVGVGGGEVYLTWFQNSRQTTLNKASIETRALRNFHLGRLAGEEDKIKAKPDVLQLVGALPDRRGRLFPHLFTFPGLLYALEELLESAHVQNS